MLNPRNKNTLGSFVVHQAGAHDGGSVGPTTAGADAAASAPHAAPVRVAVLVSGGGTNLQAILDAAEGGEIPDATIELVVADRPDAYALTRAKEAGVAQGVVAPGAGLADGLAEILARHEIDMIVLAGYLQLVPASIVRTYSGRMINVHPALLPDFGGKGWYGLRVHRGVIEAGRKVSGATVHIVTENFDEGPIVLQRQVSVMPDDTPEALQERIKVEAEWKILPRATEMLAAHLRANHA